MKYQKYDSNFHLWIEKLIGYDWKWLFQKHRTLTFEKRRDEIADILRISSKDLWALKVN